MDVSAPAAPRPDTDPTCTLPCDHTESVTFRVHMCNTGTPGRTKKTAAPCESAAVDDAPNRRLRVRRLCRFRSRAAA